MNPRHLIALASAISFATLAQGDDALRSLLEEARASGKGVNLYVNGQTIPALVISVDERYVVARSQALGQIVVRFDRLDGAAGFVAGDNQAQ